MLEQKCAVCVQPRPAQMAWPIRGAYSALTIHEVTWCVWFVLSGPSFSIIVDKIQLLG